MSAGYVPIRDANRGRDTGVTLLYDERPGFIAFVRDGNTVAEMWFAIDDDGDLDLEMNVHLPGQWMPEEARWTIATGLDASEEEE